MLCSISRWLRCLSVVLAVVLVVASIVGASDGIDNRAYNIYDGAGDLI